MPILSQTAAQTRQRFTRLYVLSLGAIAALSIVGQGFVQQQLARQASDVAVITAAQKRQMLCERLLKATLAVRMSPPQERVANAQALEQLLAEWAQTRSLIRQEMQSTLSAQEIAEVDAQFDRLKPLAQEIVMIAQQTVDGAKSGGRSRRTVSAGEALPVAQLMRAGQEFNQTIDEILQWYGRKAQAGVSRLRMLELGLLGLTIGTLIAEGCLVFRPAIRQLHESLQALEVSWQQLSQEQAKSEKLLLNILPGSIADRLKHKSEAIADGFADATVLFADIVGFTELSSRLSPQELVRRLNAIFSRFDALAEKHGLEKIKTIGDAYMIVGGLPEPNANHAVAIAQMALDMQAELRAINQAMGEHFDIRIGINSGPVVAGVIGIKKFIYDLWGDSVNVASRMESHGAAGAIHISESTYRLIQHQFHCEPRGTIAVKGKGEMTTYWLRSAQPLMSPAPLDQALLDQAPLDQAPLVMATSSAIVSE